MLRFSFSLEKLLSLRKHAEEEAKLALAEVTKRLVDLDMELAALAEKELHERAQRYRGTATEIMRTHNILVRLEKEKEALFEKKVDIELELEQRKQDWIQARAESQALNRLKEKKQEEHRKESIKQEEEAIGDAFNSRYLNHLESGNR